MRILEINTEKGWRGGERQTLYTLEALLESGAEADLLCLKGTPLYERAVRAGLKADGGVDGRGKPESWRCTQIRNQDSIKSAASKQIGGKVEDGKDREDRIRHNHQVCGKIYGARCNLDAFLFLVVNGNGYDVIHCQTSKAQSLAVLSKPFHRRPVVYTRRVDFKPSGFFTKVKYRLTDRVVAISEKIKLILAEAGLKPTEEIDVIPSAVKERQLNKRRALKLKDDLKIGNRKVIATVGSLVSHKDPLTMVEAIRLLSRKRDDFVFLHFGDGWLRGAVEERIRSQGLSDKYILVGFEEDVEDFFSIIDVFVMSSKEEGLGSAVLDAFIYGVPVVSTDAGGLRETVEGRGVLCPVGDAACLAQGIEALLDNDDLRRKLVEKAYADVKANYSIEKMADAYLGVFSSLRSEMRKK